MGRAWREQEREDVVGVVARHPEGISGAALRTALKRLSHRARFSTQWRSRKCSPSVSPRFWIQQRPSAIPSNNPSSSWCISRTCNRSRTSTRECHAWQPTFSLIRRNLCPLSFVDVPERAYIEGTLGIYELNRFELLRDVFVGRTSGLASAISPYASRWWSRTLFVSDIAKRSWRRLERWYEVFPSGPRRRFANTRSIIYRRVIGTLSSSWPRRRSNDFTRELSPGTGCARPSTMRGSAVVCRVT